MAPFAEVLQSPLGLVALAAAVPIILVYLVRPDPRNIELPTLRFLTEGVGATPDSPALERLRRELLLLLQLLVVIAVAVALAGPYVTVPAEATVSETVVIVDTSASMTAGDRFAAAQAAAREAVTGTTSVVTTAPAAVTLRTGSAAEAERAVDGLDPTAAPGDLAAAIERAAAVAGSDARLVVASDFGGNGWRDAVSRARARGYTVALRPVGDAVTNVGLTAAQYDRTSVTVTVENFGDRSATRTVTLGSATREVELGAGDTARVTLPVPAGNTRLRLAPGDDFPLDDTLYVAGPAERTTDVLLVTNNRNRYLSAALSALDGVVVTTVNPPAAVSADYDVVVFSNVNADRVLPGTLAAARGVADSGGGVVIQAQSNLGTVGYGDLLPVAVNGTLDTPTTRTRETSLTRGLAFPAPESALDTRLTAGRALVTADGRPLLVRAPYGDGTLLYYGYFSASAFTADYRYPVFWQRAVNVVAGREPLAVRNGPTGRTLGSGGATVVGPAGEATGPVVADAAGFYRIDGTRRAASLLAPTESNLTVPAVESASGSPASRTETRRVAREFGYIAALAGLAIALCEVGLLRYRGDL